MTKFLGIIGGSGLYEMEGLTNITSVSMSTPFGDPSDEIITGTLGDITLAFLPRHGKGHRITPSEINYRANIYALKTLGVDSIIAVSAVGSMKEEIVPGDLVVPHQFIDRTRGRASTFFGNGIAGHVAFADPVCHSLADIAAKGAASTGAKVHQGGTYICMEGPQFSTRAESNLYRSWGVDVIGMTNIPEAKLAREAELCYATVALATDYDCWHETEEDVSVEAILQIMRKNVENARTAIAWAARNMVEKAPCGCSEALKFAIVTDRSAIPEETKKDLEPIIGKYIK
ncbi:MAG: S-methyl-5'-thioadenosine phosphorylase [bacterium]|nr:S-methyl-5'-thioadenosine phosphorylase [bacterium]MDT8396765.1 S-methyl-5'-thioadenosine phosphorylase [bacterium]